MAVSGKEGSGGGAEGLRLLISNLSSPGKQVLTITSSLPIFQVFTHQAYIRTRRAQCGASIQQFYLNLDIG